MPYQKEELSKNAQTMVVKRKIMLLGVGPLPCYRSRALYGFGIRAWQFLLPMLKAGHQVILVTFEFGQGQGPLSIEYSAQPSLWGDVMHIPLSEPNEKNRLKHIATLMQLIREHEPEVIVTAGSSITSGLAVCLPTDLPMWIDLFGDLLAEVQAKAAFVGDEQLDFFHRLYLPILRRGDRFSSVSEAQNYATYGQLGVVGRLTGHGLGDNLVHTIPCAMDGDIIPVRGKRLLRGETLGRGDVALLCSGGFNTWADVDTLCRGVESAMERDRFIHLVVTGGAITGHHNEGFDRFVRFVERSPYRDRYHILGWIPNEDVPSTYAECDLGLNVDLDIAESMLGSRNRFLSWMQAGLPIVTTVTTEISKILASRKLCYPVQPRNTEQLTETILAAATQIAERREMAVRAQQYAYRVWTYDETTYPLLAWLQRLCVSKDRAARIQENEIRTPLDERLEAFIGDPVVRAGEGVPPPKKSEIAAMTADQPGPRPIGGSSRMGTNGQGWLYTAKRWLKRLIRS